MTAPVPPVRRTLVDAYAEGIRANAPAVRLTAQAIFESLTTHAIEQDRVDRLRRSARIDGALIGAAIASGSALLGLAIATAVTGS